jgi:hypothetical protein
MELPESRSGARGRGLHHDGHGAPSSAQFSMIDWSILTLSERQLTIKGTE